MCNKCNQTNTKCGGCNNTYQYQNICNECPPQPCDCPVVDLSTDCVLYNQDDILCEETVVVPKNTILSNALNLIVSWACQRFADVQNYFRLINIGIGSEIYAGDNLLGEKKLRKLNSGSPIVTITQNTNDITFDIDEDVLNESINIDNVGTGAEPYKGFNTLTNTHEFRTVLIDSQSGMGESFVRDVQQNTNDITVRVKKIKSNTLSIASDDEEISLNMPTSATIPALYVNSLYEPTYEDWFNAGGNVNPAFLYRGEGTLARPFTNSRNYTSTVAFTDVPDTAIQNALDGHPTLSYVGAGLDGTRLSPNRVGEQIIVQDNTTSYTFNGDFNYSNINIKFEGDVGCTTTGWIIDMDNPLYFDTNTSNFTINVDEGKVLQLIDSLGFRNSGNTSSTPPSFDTGRAGLFLGEGTVHSSYNGVDILTRYILNSDGNNNDSQLHFLVKCKLRADYQSVYLSKNKARYDFYNAIQSGVYLGSVNTSLQAFRMTGGKIRFFDKGSISISSETSGRNYGLTFEPENDGIGYCDITLNATKITGNCNYLFAKLNNQSVTLNVYNSPSGSDFSTTLPGNLSPVNGLFQNLGVSLWSVTFKNNIFSYTGIDFTKVDLTGGNGISSINITGDAVIESLRAFSSKENARLAGLPVNSAFLLKRDVNAVDLVQGTEYKVTTFGDGALGALGTYFIATGSETGTAVGSLVERCILI